MQSPVNIFNLELIISWTPIIISVLALLVSIFWNQKLQKDQYKIQYRLIFVKEIYPPLMKDIRHTLGIIHNYTQKEIFVHQLFNDLKNIYASGQIEFIKIDSPNLFNNLDRIMNEILPQANELQKIKMDYLNHTKEKWGSDLFEKNIYTINLNEFIELVTSTLHWYLWKGEYGTAKSAFERIYEDKTNALPNEKIPDKNDYEVFLKYELEEKEIIRKEIIKINGLIEEIINKKVIPELNEIISKPID